MTTIVICKSKDGSYRSVTCMGHAGYAKKHLFYKEPDILCAAISVTVQNTMNSLEELAGEIFRVTENEQTGFLKCDFEAPLQEKSIFLLDSMVYCLKNLSREYGEQYLQVKFEEV
ncbi:MAG: ribosomal-processing cysteine protease Prp [Acetatifactor sp.]